MLALCTAAVLAGNAGIEEMMAWVHRAPQEVLAACGARRNGPGAYVAPHPGTVERPPPRIVAALRNPAVGLIRQAGHNKINWQSKSLIMQYH